ncbi:MAG TPA: hypothetical protein VM824_04955 [Thermoleophilaceae bacterium]|nr:hypothetical protein [Thermoleophilaceae bacterium]
MQVAGALKRRDRLGVAAAGRERLDRGEVLVQALVGGERGADVLVEELGHHAAAPVRIRDHDLRAGPGLATKLARIEVAGVQDRRPLRERAEGGQAREPLGRPVHDRGPPGGHAHEPAAGPDVVAPHLRHARGSVELPSRGRGSAHGPVGARGLAEALPGQLLRRRGGVHAAAARDVVVASGDHRARPDQPKQRP